ncbi:MAG: type II toxin-antitoxin system death-on-curing family toxin [Longimicrobiales bacterium]
MELLDRAILDVLHERLMHDFGGALGVRGDALIDAALARAVPRPGRADRAELARLGACYGYGLAKKRGYLDGNRRLAAVAMGVFLLRNGFELAAPEAELQMAMDAVESGDWSERELAAWISDRAVERRPT